MTWVSGLLCAAALLWPDHLLAPFDGVPLDQRAEALAIGVLFPALWWFHPQFLGTRIARLLIAILAAWKVASVVFLTQQGWCVRFEPGQPYVWDQTGAPHSWDIRADWRSPAPRCSAIMTRTYWSLAEFPVWFFNLPPPNQNWPGPLDRPPGATTRMTVSGFLSVREPGTFRVDSSPDITTIFTVDGGPAVDEVRLDPGPHRIDVDATLTGQQWRFAPTLNNADIWSLLTTTTRPSRVDILVGRRGGWLPALLIIVLLGSWAVSAIAHVRDWWAVAWSSTVTVCVVWLVSTDRTAMAAWAIAALMLAGVIPVRTRNRNLRGAFLMFGVPWLGFVVAGALPSAGRFALYGSGNDYWMFQRFAYRIVMQGYWLEGGSPTFWFQALYRWIAGLLHVVFGDSSLGESLWDGGCLLSGALLSFRLVREFAGFRWGLVSGAMPLAVFVLGTPHYLIGLGLGEISSAGFLAVAALYAIRSRHGSRRAAAIAGVLATLAFYARMNNLLMAFGVSVFGVAVTHRRRARWRSAAIIVAVISVGMLLLAWRTWHYTGVFSLFYGTQRSLLTLWQPGMGSGEVMRRMVESALMVLSVNDPPRFDGFDLPVLSGAIVAVLWAVRVPRIRRIPAAPVLFFFSAIAAAFVARGSAYAGRFSVHILPITCALTTAAVAVLSRSAAERPTID